MPLTSRNVYQLLQKRNSLNAIPEGRVITQGIAAVTGFTLGLKKAIGATLLYDIITANITEDATNHTSNTPMYLTQEICFGSRIARSLYEAEAIAEAYSRLEEKSNNYKATVRKSHKKRLSKPKRNKRKRLRNNFRYKNTHGTRPKSAETAAATSEAAEIAATANDATEAIQPTTQDKSEGDLYETNLNTGYDTDTTSTTTSTDNDQTITCIVIQKPKT